LFAYKMSFYHTSVRLKSDTQSISIPSTDHDFLVTSWPIHGPLFKRGRHLRFFKPTLAMSQTWPRRPAWQSCKSSTGLAWL
jgi:hypothetical protein